MNLFRDLKLSRKVFLLVIFLLGAFAVLFIQYEYGQSLLDEADEKDRNVRQLGSLINKVELDILEARKVEKDFLLYNDKKYVDSHKAITDGVAAGIETLSAELEKSGQQELGKNLTSSFAAYRDNFNQVVELKVQFGLDDEKGLRAKLARNAKNIERILKGSNELDLQARMMFVRRHEMNFINTLDPVHQRRLERDLETMRGKVPDAEITERYKTRITEAIVKYLNTFLEVAGTGQKTAEGIQAFRDAAAALAPILNQLKAQGDEILAENRRALEASNNKVELQFSIILVVVALVACGVLWLGARGIIRGISKAAEIGENVAAGDLDNKIGEAPNDEIGTLLKTLDRMQVQLKERIEEDQRIANEALRIQTALDNASTSVLVVNPDYKVIYINKSAQEMFSSVEEDIQGEMPEFSAENVLGSSMDLFHRNPEHQREILDQLEGTHRARITLAGHVFDMTVNIVDDARGERLGFAMEWSDVTDQVNVEQEIDQVVGSVAGGDLGQRIELVGKEGFFHSLGSGINELTGAVEESIDEVENVLESLSMGSLMERVSSGKRGAFGRLSDNVNSTIERLLETVMGIRESTSIITSSSSEIARGNEDMSRRTESQAANLEETASTMEEFTSSVKHNADSAQQANQLALNASSLAGKGGEVVDEAVSAMAEITEASEKIANIIGVIDDIAFQTNLLALNASVEAARAGEQGRGFAVVATEVRNLAQRSAAAAKEIKNLIVDSGGKVQAGTLLVNQSGETLQEIVTAVKKVTDIIAEIAAASREQSLGIEQVNKAITEMDGVTQQNAALAEETSSASRMLNDQAGRLRELVDFFKTEG
jgi:methyl-accepting chemotaxis protein